MATLDDPTHSMNGKPTESRVFRKSVQWADILCVFHDYIEYITLDDDDDSIQNQDNIQHSIYHYWTTQDDESGDEPVQDNSYLQQLFNKQSNVFTFDNVENVEDVENVKPVNHVSDSDNSDSDNSDSDNSDSDNSDSDNSDSDELDSDELDSENSDYEEPDTIVNFTELPTNVYLNQVNSEEEDTFEQVATNTQIAIKKYKYTIEYAIQQQALLHNALLQQAIRHQEKYHQTLQKEMLQVARKQHEVRYQAIWH